MYYIALCDDNAVFLNTIERTIMLNCEFRQDMVCQKFISGMELLNSEVEKYHLIILDMQMDHNMDGFETAKAIRKRNSSVVLAFCSGVIMPQPEHFEVQPYRYLLKKVETDKMQSVISELLIEMKCRKGNEIEVVYDGRACRINVKNILYVSRIHRRSELEIEEVNQEGIVNYKKIQSNEKLADWYHQLESYGFEYAHTSYIVNIQKIVRVEKDDIFMNNGQILHISRTCKQKFREKFAGYFCKKYRRGAGE